MNKNEAEYDFFLHHVMSSYCIMYNITICGNELYKHHAFVQILSLFNVFICVFLALVSFFYSFYVPFKIISAHMRQANQ